MTAKVIISKLSQAIKNNNNRVIESQSHELIKLFADASKEASFYDLPFDLIQSIIKQVDFTDPDITNDPQDTLKTVIEKTSIAHGEKAVLLLNVFHTDNLPEFTIGETALILGKFKNSELLTKLGIQQEEEDMLLVRDYDWEINQLKQEITQRDQQIAQLKQKVEENQYETNDFYPPITRKPSDFIDNIIEAVEKGKLTSVRYLIEVEGEDPNIIHRGSNLLHIACRSGKLSIVKYLCEKTDIDKEARGVYDMTPFYLACLSGELKVVKYLCEKQKVNKETPDRYDKTPFWIACKYRFLDIIKYLCENCDINKSVICDGKSPYDVTGDEVREYLESIGIDE